MGRGPPEVQQRIILLWTWEGRFPPGSHKSTLRNDQSSG